MNKKIMLGVPLTGIAVVALAYAGSAWYAGAQLEKHLNAGLAELTAASPLIKLSEVRARRGIFHTEHEMTLGLNPDCIDTGIAAKKPAMQQELDKIKLRLRHTITHGPLSFAAGVQPALAAYEGGIVLDKETIEKLAKVLGEQPALSWNGIVKFDGSHRFSMQSPAFEIKDGASHLRWAGIQGEGSGNLHDKSYQLTLRAPKLVFTAIDMGAGQTGTGLMENMHVTAAGRQGTSKLGIGNAAFGIDKLEVASGKGNQGFNMSKLAYTAAVKEAGQFIDMQFDYHIASIEATAEQMKFGPVALEMGLAHLHAPTLAELGDSMNKLMCAKPEQKEALTQETMEQWKRLLATLLQNKPEFHLRQAKLGTPDGDMQLKGQLRIDGFEPAMFDNPQAAMALLPGVVNIEFAGQAGEKFLMSTVRNFAASGARKQMLLAGGGEVPPEQISALQDGAEHSARQQLELALAQNFVKQEDGQLRFHFSFSKGQASLNGAPFNLPFLPQTAAAPMADNPAALTAAPGPARQ